MDIGEAAGAGVDAAYLLDMVSNEAEHLSCVYDEDSGWWADGLELEMPGSAGLFLETLELKPEFRGQGLGPVALAMIIERLGTGCSLVAMEPHPMGQPTGGKSVDEAIAALGRTWVVLGFEEYRDGVWILDLGLGTFRERKRDLFKL